MNKDAIWGVLVLILVASLAAAVIERDDAAVGQEPPANQEEPEEQTSANETVPVHDDGHLHAAPILSLISAEDDGATISMYGFVIHAHPNETLVNVVFENESIAQMTPDPSGLWNFTVATNATGDVSLNFTANHVFKGVPYKFYSLFKGNHKASHSWVSNWNHATLCL